ncbi:MAG: hypothetical protein ACREQ9_09460 [Candidatus Binatia bacterium]
MSSSVPRIGFAFRFLSTLAVATLTVASGVKPSPAVDDCRVAGFCDLPDDGNPCTGDDVCDQATGECFYFPRPPGTACPDTDGDACTTAACDGSGSCDQNHEVRTCEGDDGNDCTGDPVCNPDTGTCSFPPLDPGTPCGDTDGDACTTAACTADGVCDQEHETVSCAGEDLPDRCCDPADGVCKADPRLDPACAEVDEICRTAGFWSTHAGTEKDRANNITGDVIAAAGGCLEICGEIIDETSVDSADSALEALCVKIEGETLRQLARQLTAAALNCVITNGSGDCTGVSVESLFQACNAACAAGGVTAQVDGSSVDCIAAIDCFNSGGAFDTGSGECSSSDRNCESRPLVNETLGLDFDPPGPAGSPKACKSAKKSKCTVVGSTEAECGSGTISGSPEECPLF